MEALVSVIVPVYKVEKYIARCVDALINQTLQNIEIILATNPTMEGEVTALYIKKKIEALSSNRVKITRIGSGLPMGADLEFADQATLSRAMDGRREL